MVRTTQLESDGDIINLGIGQPPLSLLPAALMQASAATRFAMADRSWLQYGPEEGDGHFRLALAAFLTESYGVPVAAEELFITAGASQGMYLLATMFSRPGDTIYVEEPSYFLALRLFADLGLRIVGLPTDDDGLLVEALEERLADAGPDEKPAFIYIIPVFQNPRGVTLSEERRARLAEVSEKHDLLVIADEVYQLLSYGSPPPAPMPWWSSGGRLLSLGSFSKILAPGLRLGWIQARADIVQRMAGAGLVKSGGGLNPFASALVYQLLESGAQAGHVNALRDAYRGQLAALCEGLDSALPEQASYFRPEGGYFVWLRVPGIDAADLLPAAREAGVAYHPGTLFSSNQGLQHAMRLCFAHYSEGELAEAARRLGSVIRAAT